MRIFEKNPLLAGEREMDNIDRKVYNEIVDYNKQRSEFWSDYRAEKITYNTLDQLERDLSTAHLERLRKIRKGY